MSQRGAFKVLPAGWKKEKQKRTSLVLCVRVYLCGWKARAGEKTGDTLARLNENVAAELLKCAV